MPWKAIGKKIVRKDTGEVVGHSSSHEKAQASVRARYANYDKKKGKKKHGGMMHHREEREYVRGGY